jgi:hypothetical protein
VAVATPRFLVAVPLIISFYIYVQVRYTHISPAQHFFATF